jgi:hypothetical protein
MNNIATIETEISKILATITEFKKVYTYEPMEIFELPAASIFYSGFDSNDQSMPNSQEVSENWILRIYVKLDDAKTAQDAMKTLIPKARDAFRKNRGLSGACLYTLLDKGEVFAVMDKNNAQLIAELHLSAITEEY